MESLNRKPSKRSDSASYHPQPGVNIKVSEDAITRCEGVFRCGTMETHCRKHATLRRCGKHFCDSCARWNRHTLDTREVQRCPQHDNGKPCNNLAGTHRLGWCDEHAAAYDTMANNLRTEIDRLK